MILTRVQAILGVADLEQITVKKIRNALQELFEIDLKPHKVCKTNSKEYNKDVFNWSTNIERGFHLEGNQQIYTRSIL